MREGLAGAARLYPGQALRIGAQQRLEHFYAAFGFRTVSAPYQEDGIAHVEMLLARRESAAASSFAPSCANIAPSLTETWI